MPPINSNGSSLKVTTIIGDKKIEGDGIASHTYGLNQQREGRKPLDTNAPGNATPFQVRPTKEYEMSDDMAQALNEELASKGFTGKKRTRKPSTKKTDSK